MFGSTSKGRTCRRWRRGGSSRYRTCKCRSNGFGLARLNSNASRRTNGCRPSKRTSGFIATTGGCRFPRKSPTDLATSGGKLLSGAIVLFLGAARPAVAVVARTAQVEQTARSVGAGVEGRVVRCVGLVVVAIGRSVSLGLIENQRVDGANAFALRVRVVLPRANSPVSKGLRAVAARVQVGAAVGSASLFNTTVCSVRQTSLQTTAVSATVF